MSNTNPYENGQALQSESPKKSTFCWFALLGMVLLFVGYFGSLVMAFQIYAAEGMGPFEGVFAHSYQEIWLLSFAMLVATTGGILVGGNRFESMLAVVYIMCPLIGVSFGIGCPLRLAKNKWILPVSAIYLIGGMALAGACITFLTKAYGTENFAAIGAVLGTVVGLAMALGALLKLWNDDNTTQQVSFGQEAAPTG